MNAQTVKDAMRAAKEFLRRAQAVEKYVTEDSWVNPSKESGALRRASMDLTRALADMRRPN